MVVSVYFCFPVLNPDAMSSNSSFGGNALNIASLSAWNAKATFVSIKYGVISTPWIESTVVIRSNEKPFGLSRYFGLIPKTFHKPFFNVIRGGSSGSGGGSYIPLKKKDNLTNETIEEAIEEEVEESIKNVPDITIPEPIKEIPLWQKIAFANLVTLFIICVIAYYIHKKNVENIVEREENQDE